MIATESGHWYTRDGQPCYEIAGKDGTLRGTTLRDARKLNLYPSVTTVCSVLDKPGLKQYFRREMFSATATTPRLPGMTDEDYFAECCKWADEHSMLAREAGTDVHASLEAHIKGKLVQPEHFDLCNKVVCELEKVSIPLMYGKAERSFAHPAGFGGKIDASGDGWVVDFKSKKTLDKKLAYDQNVQLAAYAWGLGIEAPRLLNVFVGVEDGNVVVHEWDAVEAGNGLEIFKHALAIWQLQKQYKPTTNRRNDQ
jgi:hypothetical protein